MEKRVINKSKEDYLEAILIIINKYGACRVTDIAQQTGYTKSSVSVALKKLEEDALIERSDWRILLTEEGRKLAQSVYEKHNFFLKWFRKLGIEDDIALEDACMIEHVISEESFNKIREYLGKNDEEFRC